MKNTLQLQLPTGTWVLDASATSVTITARKLLAFTVPATLTVTSGSIEIADEGVVSVEVAADASSYASKNAKRNEHIVGPDLLDAANHPAIRFQAHDVAWSATGGTAAGSITVKGRTTSRRSRSRTSTGTRRRSPPPPASTAPISVSTSCRH